MSTTAQPNDASPNASGQAGQAAEPRRRSPASTTIPESLGTSELIPILEYLLVHVRDSELRARTALAHVSDTDARVLIETIANRRRETEGELKSLILSLGDDAPIEGSFIGLLHREWIDLKAAALHHQPHRTLREMLRECIRGERALLRAYQYVLRYTLPFAIRDSVEDERALVVYAIERLKEYEAEENAGMLA